MHEPSSLCPGVAGGASSQAELLLPPQEPVRALQCTQKLVRQRRDLAPPLGREMAVCEPLRPFYTWGTWAAPPLEGIRWGTTAHPGHLTFNLSMHLSLHPLALPASPGPVFSCSLLPPTHPLILLSTYLSIYPSILPPIHSSTTHSPSHPTPHSSSHPFIHSSTYLSISSGAHLLSSCSAAHAAPHLSTSARPLNLPYISSPSCPPTCPSVPASIPWLPFPSSSFL